MNLSAGKVGPFFYIKDKVYSDSVEWSNAETYGNFKTWGSHDKFWRTIPSNIRKPLYSEYTQCPRGRVTYNYKQDKYFIYLYPKLNCKDAIEKIIKEFNLQKCDIVVDTTDEHYRTLF